jgi:hypothetical protein
VKQFWENLRNVREQDAGHTNKQFILTMNYILGQLIGRFKTWKISDQFKEAWKNDPDNVPDNVGAIIAEDMTIKIFGPFGDPGRDLEAMVRRYNSSSGVKPARLIKQLTKWLLDVVSIQNCLRLFESLLG